MDPAARAALLQGNPHRSAVLGWYRRCLRAAFTIPWTTDDDALYVLEETRRLFRQNQSVRDAAVIARKVREAELRYELAVHYRIPQPRPYHMVQGVQRDLQTSVAYAPYMDSFYDGAPVNPRVGGVDERSTGGGIGTASLEIDARTVRDDDLLLPNLRTPHDSNRESSPHLNVAR